jgi:hypothetical protein
MIRTVPDTGSEDIDLYMRTYYSLLRTTDAIKIQSLVETHMSIDSSLHVHARDEKIDVSTLVYATLRLPAAIIYVRQVILGQLIEDFRRVGHHTVDQWQRVHAPGRRRRTHWNGSDILAVMIASRSDIDDIIPILTSLQIEWNKVHQAFQRNPQAHKLLKTMSDNDQKPGNIDTNTLLSLGKYIGIEVADLSRLQSAWKGHFFQTLQAMASRKADFQLQLLAGSAVNYRKAAGRWWGHLYHCCDTEGQALNNRAIYFVSSNTHAIANLVSGHASALRDKLSSFMHELNNADLLGEFEALEDEFREHVHNNFYYYLLKKYHSAHPQAVQAALDAEKAAGLLRVPPKQGFDIESQIIDIRKLSKDRLDPRVCDGLEIETLAHSDAAIINIDYPLGLAAFELLSRVVEGTDTVLGVYVMGKAATLNGRIGDVMLANVVHDEHSQNTYIFDNCFKSGDIVPYMAYGSVLDNQKAITARGTFLQNRNYMDVFYREGYTVLEMEAGPYLSVLYEMIRPVRHPYNEIVNLYPAPFDVGFIHYASDTPFSRGHNLGAGSLGYHGMDSTYGSAVAILRKIFQCEIQRIKQHEPAISG